MLSSNPPVLSQSAPYHTSSCTSDSTLKVRTAKASGIYRTPPPPCAPACCRMRSSGPRDLDTPPPAPGTNLHIFSRQPQAPPAPNLRASTRGPSPRSNQIPFDPQTATRFRSTACSSVPPAIQTLPADPACTRASRSSLLPNTSPRSACLSPDSTPRNPRHSKFPPAGPLCLAQRLPTRNHIPSSVSPARI